MNRTGLVAQPGVTNAIASLGAYKVLYVDAEAETDEGATGSADNPYATIQAAVNAAQARGAAMTAYYKNQQNKSKSNSGSTWKKYNIKGGRWVG